MIAVKHHITKRIRRYLSQDEGATAIEFALVAIPFFSLIFAIIELSIIFFINSVLTHATSESGRLIRIGQFQNCGGATAFKQLVCNEMNNLGNCQQNLRVDVVSEPTFSAIMPPNTNVPPPTPGMPAPPFMPPDGTFTPGIVASQPVVVRSTFYYRLALPPQLTQLESTRGTGIRELRSVTAFRTEPFPPSTACP